MKFEKILNEESRKLKSFRNEVSLVSFDNSKAVKKVYKNLNSMQIEMKNLKILNENKVPAPSVLSIKDNIAFIQRIEGVDYVEIIDRIEDGLLSVKNIDKVAKELSEWLTLFYNATNGASRGDVNLRNFIFTTMGKCASVDFEEKFQIQDKEVDMGRILAYTATYEPALTYGKLQLCKAFLKYFLEMDASLSKIENEYMKQLEIFENRRLGFSKIKENTIKYFELIKK